MAIEFDNPLTAGTVLIRSAIQSQNYNPGIAGWIIEADGDAEFNNLVVRGTFQGTRFTINNDGMFFYSGVPANGNLIASIASVAGTDSFGNPYRRGVFSYSSLGDFSGISDGQVQLGTKETPASPFGPVAGAIGLLSLSRGNFFTGSTNSTYNLAGRMALNAGYSSVQGDVGYPNLATTVDGWIEGAWRSTTNQIPDVWNAFPFVATWAGATAFNGALNTPFSPMQYRKDAEDNCWIYGLGQSSGTAMSIGTLPAGYFNPNNRSLIPANFNIAGVASSGFMQVTETGVVNSSLSLGGKTIASGSQIYINAKFPLGNLT
jgi:hypothetical protein